MPPYQEAACRRQIPNIGHDKHDGLTKLVLVVYPGLSAAVFVMSYIWDLSSAKLLLGMAALVSFAIGLYLIRNEHAYDGEMFVMDSDEGVRVFTLQLDRDPAELDQKNSVSFKVTKREPMAEVDL